MKAAFVFPGQGAQHVGMGKDLYDGFEEVRSIYSEASAALGYDVAGLSFEGPQEELNKTFRTQPCILTASYAAFRVLVSKGATPFVMAGHSLGEYSALVAAGVVSFSDGVRLTEKRGIFMQEAVPEGEGLMAAVLGLDRNSIDEICLAVENGYVSPANYNCPGQIVIAGEKQAVEEALKRCKEAGAKRAVPLSVSVPSHCTLMVEASNRLSELLDTVRFRDSEISIVNNADAMFLSTSDKIKASLVKQLNSPLLWEDSVRKMAGAGVEVFVEVGPGKVLSGLIRRIEPSAKVLNVEDRKSLDASLKELGL